MQFYHRVDRRGQSCAGHNLGRDLSRAGSTPTLRQTSISVFLQLVERRRNLRDYVVAFFVFNYLPTVRQAVILRMARARTRFAAGCRKTVDLTCRSLRRQVAVVQLCSKDWIAISRFPEQTVARQGNATSNSSSRNGGSHGDRSSCLSRKIAGILSDAVGRWRSDIGPKSPESGTASGHRWTRWPGLCLSQRHILWTTGGLT